MGMLTVSLEIIYMIVFLITYQLGIKTFLITAVVQSIQLIGLALLGNF